MSRSGLGIVVTIDYDRLTAGGTASYYVSYDNMKVGEDQGTALTQCAQVKGKAIVNYVEIDGADVAIKLASEILAGQKPTAPAQTKDPTSRPPTSILRPRRK